MRLQLLSQQSTEPGGAPDARSGIPAGNLAFLVGLRNRGAIGPGLRLPPPTVAMAASRDWDRACLHEARDDGVSRGYFSSHTSFLSRGPVVPMTQGLRKRSSNSPIRIDVADAVRWRAVKLQLPFGCSGGALFWYFSTAFVDHSKPAEKGSLAMSLAAGTSACASMRDL